MTSNISKLAGLLVLLAIAAGGFLSVNRSKTTESITTHTEANLPYATIVRGKLFVLEADEKTRKSEVQDGESITLGTILGTAVDSRAHIYFPDGSVLRMDANTRVTINASQYDTSSGKLVAKIGLLWGNVWSKVIGLATPDSAWEVETPHAVATVRGTAFGTSYTNGKTSFLGSEHSVGVRVRNPKTKELLPVKELVFKEKQTLEITSEQTTTLEAELKNGTTSVEKKAESLLAVKASSGTVERQEWVIDSRTEDDKLLEKIEELRTETPNRERFIEELKREIREEQVEAKPNIFPVSDTKETPVLKDDLKTEAILQKDPVETKPTTEIVTPALSGGTVRTENAKLLVVAEGKTEGVTEGDIITFAAYLVDTSGAKRKIEKGVTWSTSGLVGSVSTTGIFTAKLHPEIAEVGEASGTVEATFVDTNGTKLQSSSLRFVVRAKVEENFDQAI